jgi:hypothetical protein
VSAEELDTKPPFRPSRQGAAALGLRLAGAGYDEIAETLGCEHAWAAREAVEATLANRALADRDGRERLRAEEGARLLRLLRSVWTKAMTDDHPEHLPAVKVAADLIARHTRLYGLDAPAEIVVHSPTAAEIDRWVAARVSSTTAPLRAMEAVVVDAEIVE